VLRRRGPPPPTHTEENGSPLLGVDGVCRRERGNTGGCS